ncbi:hypothetical protein PCANC_21005 [Puccinia coronata f. sp. avenae]|uniref:Uncharacterized protein n=1 Tax=Puccinia coronata f. sp. avenae TaxID=200324 RepID=A0A2N5U6A2_9BASI|nr:hypothetical protein PCANC_21005 [Puccinia coronata f. sp. avenae]
MIRLTRTPYRSRIGWARAADKPNSSGLEFFFLLTPVHDRRRHAGALFEQVIQNTLKFESAGSSSLLSFFIKGPPSRRQHTFELRGMITTSSRSVPVLRRKQNLIFSRLSSSSASHPIASTSNNPQDRRTELDPQDQIQPSIQPVYQPPQPRPKPSARRAIKILKKICRSRDPLNPLLDQFITGNNPFPSPSRCLSNNHQTNRSVTLGGNTNQPDDPVSTSLSELGSSKKIYSSSQAMDRSIRKLIEINTLSRTPPQPSTSKVSLDYSSAPRPDNASSTPPILNPTFRSLEQAFQWSQIYIRFLKSSPNQEIFAKRIKELVHKRLPKRLIEPIVRFHRSEEELVSIESYNHLIAYYYQSERYHHARKLMKEMEERGISKNQETQELIACSYQALNKFKGVQLALDSIRADGHQVSNQCLTKLFSIRPRRPFELEHFDSMDDPAFPSGSDHPSIKTSTKKSLPTMTEDQRWMPIEDFLNHHDWNSENFRKDGRALVTLTKRLMELGRWKEAKQFADMILTLDLNQSTVENSRPAISPYWATSLLEALVFGLYNLKRQQSTRKSIPPPRRSQIVLNKIGAVIVHDARLPVDCIFQFVEQFIDQHLGHQIKANTRILLNCFRIQTFLAPSQIHRISTVWPRQYGLKPDRMGSRLGIRLLHVISAWFLRLLRSTQSQISCLDRCNPSSTLVREIRRNLTELVKEYLIIDEHLIQCLNLHRTRTPSSPPLGTAAAEEMERNKRREDLLIEKMILNGPVDGKLMRANYRFISLQDLQSIKLSLKKIFKIRTKILRLMLLNFRASNNPSPQRPTCTLNTRPDGTEEKDELDGCSSADLVDFYRSVFGGDAGLVNFLREKQSDANCSPFNRKFHDLMDRFQTHQSQAFDSSPSEHHRQLRLELIDKLPTPTGPPTPTHHPSAYHALVCWRSEDRDSPPIYIKPSSQ